MNPAMAAVPTPMNGDSEAGARCTATLLTRFRGIGRGLESIKNDLLSELGEGLLLLVVTGSQVRNTATARSDIDICAFISEPWHQFRCFEVDGIDVELNITSVLGYAQERRLQANYFSDLFSDGYCLHDTGGWFERLSDASRVSRRPRLSSKQLAWCRRRPKKLCSDIRDALDMKRHDVDFVLWGSLWELTNLYYVLDGLDPVKPKNRLSNLLRRSPRCAIAVQAFLSARTSEAKLRALTLLGDCILQKHGGPLGKYSTEREAVIK